MNDRELLEYAAKAAGYVIESHTKGGAWVYAAGSLPNADGEYPIFLWNPLTDDGDAFRLAIKLSLSIEVGGESVCVITKDNKHVIIESGVGDLIYSATRRSITRAAAEIGRAATQP